LDIKETYNGSWSKNELGSRDGSWSKKELGSRGGSWSKNELGVGADLGVRVN